jgi:hypothetical protein
MATANEYVQGKGGAEPRSYLPFISLSGKKGQGFRQKG